MNWVVMKAGRICPTVMEEMNQQEAIDLAIILARYDGQEYTVSQEVFVARPEGNSVEIRRIKNNRMVMRETFHGVEGTKDDV